jgi:hypothetical protein
MSDDILNVDDFLFDVGTFIDQYQSDEDFNNNDEEETYDE